MFLIAACFIASTIASTLVVDDTYSCVERCISGECLLAVEDLPV